MRPGGRSNDVVGIRRQFHQAIDIVPTILEVAGVKAPKTVNGIAQKLIEGVSMAYPSDIGADTGPPVDDADYQVRSP